MADTDAPKTAKDDQAAQQKAILAKVEEAFAIRQKGNDAFKEGDMTAALRFYYTTLLHLKGLDTSINQAFPKPREPIVASTSTASPTTTTEEAPAEVVSEMSTKAAATAKAETKAKAEEESLEAKVKTTIGITYTNMAACHIRAERWPKALHFAQQALAIDDKNRKARFREAQARIGLGEIVNGRRILEDLDKDDGDASIKAALKNLYAKEKERDQKAKQQLKGFLNTGTKKASAAASPASTSTAVSS